MKRDNRTKKPKYQTLVDALRKKIVSAEWLVGTQIPAEPEICRKFRMSRGTVRHAVSTLVQEGLLLRNPPRGTFVSTPLDPKIKLRASNKIFGLVVPSLDHFYCIEMFKGMQRILEGRGFYLVLETSNNDPQRETLVLQRLTERVSGVGVFPTEKEITMDHFLSVQRAGIPIVIIHRDIAHPRLDYVAPALYNGGFLLTEHLIAHGHRHIGYITRDAQNYLSWETIERGYRAALERHAFEWNPSLVFRCRLNYDDPDPCHDTFLDSMREMAETVLRAEPQPTALIVVNYQFADALAHCFIERGVQVPDDLALVTVGKPGPNADKTLAITRMDHSLAAVGERAARLIVERLVNPEKAVEHVLIGGELIVGKSCGTHERTGEAMVAVREILPQGHRVDGET